MRGIVVVVLSLWIVFILVLPCCNKLIKMRGSRLKCCVIGCGKNLGEVRLHKFPSHVQQCMSWIKFCRNEDVLADNVEKYRICSNHFSDSNYIDALTKIRLVKNAIPTEMVNGDEEVKMPSVPNVIASDVEKGIEVPNSTSNENEEGITVPNPTSNYDEDGIGIPNVTLNYDEERSQIPNVTAICIVDFNEDCNESFTTLKSYDVVKNIFIDSLFQVQVCI